MPVGDIIIRRYEIDFHFYADDSQLYLAFEQTSDEQLAALVRMETCVRYGKIDSWMVNKLKLTHKIGATFDRHMSLDQHVIIIFARHNTAKIIDYLSTADTEILVHALLNWIVVIHYYTSCQNP